MLQIEILEIGNDIAPVGVDAGHADHGAREASSGLVGHVGGVDLGSDVAERLPR